MRINQIQLMSKDNTAGVTIEKNEFGVCVDIQVDTIDSDINYKDAVAVFEELRDFFDSFTHSYMGEGKALVNIFGGDEEQ